MTIGLLKGTSSWGHSGWVTVYCRVCGAKMNLSGQKPRSRKVEVVYACPKCAEKYEAYFCAADARFVKYTCPFCGTKLEIVSPQPVTRR